MKYLVPLTLTWVILLQACSSGVQISSDLDDSVDFSKYKTYRFLGWQENSDQLMSDFDKKRVHEAFINEFDARGLTFKEDQADAAVALYLVVNEKTSITGYTDYYGGYGRYGRYGGGWGSGYSTTTYTEDHYLYGVLVMDVFDEATGQQIWQGVAQGVITENPEKRAKSIPKNIAKLMRYYPVAVVKK